MRIGVNHDDFWWSHPRYMWKHDVEYISNHIWSSFYIIQTETDFRRPLKSRNLKISILREWGYILKTQKNHFHSSCVGVKMIFFDLKWHKGPVKQKVTPVVHTPGVKVKNHNLYWITNKTLGQNVNKWYIMIFSLFLDWFSHVHRDSEWNTDSEWKHDGFT